MQVVSILDLNEYKGANVGSDMELLSLNVVQQASSMYHVWNHANPLQEACVFTRKFHAYFVHLRAQTIIKLNSRHKL